MWIRLLKRQLAVLIVSWAAAAMVVMSLVLVGREMALERGHRSSAAFAAIVEQQTARTFQAINLTLGAVVDVHHLEPRPRKHDPDFQEMLTRRLGDIPFVRAIFFIGPDGWLIHDTDYPRTPDVTLADRAYFRLHQADPELDSAVSVPILSRSGTGWFVAITRRLGRSAAFEGIAVAAVQAGEFRKQYEGIGLEHGDLIALFHQSGTLVARHPGGEEDIGRSFDALPVFVTYLAKNSSGTFRTTEGIVPGERVVSYRVVAGTPFVIWVSRSKAALLSEWRRTAVGAAVAMAALTLLLALFIAYVIREHARQERARERRAQAEKLEALGQLTGGIAHDFGNMLSVISMNLALLRQSPADAQVVDKAFSVAEHAIDRGADLIERLLGFAKRQPLKVTETDVNEVVATVRELLAHAAPPRIRLTVEPGAALPKVLCDASQLEIALLNLVLNARDAIEGAGRITLRTYLCDDDNAPAVIPGGPASKLVCLAVQDSGAGMTEEVRKRVLEPFFTTKGNAGTGLGLSQVYGFMQQIGGSIRIDSAPGRGTTVYAFFPIASKGKGLQ